MTVEIEKGIPIPEVTNRMRKYPWDKMEIGDSFLAKSKGNISLVSFQNQKRKPKKFVQRKVEGGIRIWRVE